MCNVFCSNCVHPYVEMYVGVYMCGSVVGVLLCFTLDLLRFGSVNVCGSAQHGINASYRVVGVKMKPTWRICFSDVSPDSKMHC